MASLTIHRELPYWSRTASFYYLHRQNTAQPYSILLLIVQGGLHAGKACILSPNGKEITPGIHQTLKEPWTENHFIKFSLITDNGMLCWEIKDWRLKVALESKTPDRMVVECPTALNFLVCFRVMEMKDQSCQLCFRGMCTGTADSPWMEAELWGMPRCTESIMGSPAATRTRTN